MTKEQDGVWQIANLCLSTSEGGLENWVAQSTEMFERLGYSSLMIARKGSRIANSTNQKAYPIVCLRRWGAFFDFIQLFKIYVQTRFQFLVAHRSPGVLRAVLLKQLFPSLKVIWISHSFLNVKKMDFYQKSPEDHVHSLKNLDVTVNGDIFEIHSGALCD